jgi:hypothetical protein
MMVIDCWPPRVSVVATPFLVVIKARGNIAWIGDVHPIIIG